MRTVAFLRASKHTSDKENFVYFKVFLGVHKKNKPHQPKSMGLFSHLDSEYKGPGWNPPIPISLTLVFKVTKCNAWKANGVPTGGNQKNKKHEGREGSQNSKGMWDVSVD